MDIYHFKVIGGLQMLDMAWRHFPSEWHGAVSARIACSTTTAAAEATTGASTVVATVRIVAANPRAGRAPSYAGSLLE